MSSFLTTRRRHHLGLLVAELPVALLTDWLGAGENAPHRLLLMVLPLACRRLHLARGLWWRPLQRACITTAAAQYFTAMVICASLLCRKEDCLSLGGTGRGGSIGAVECRGAQSSRTFCELVELEASDGLFLR